MMKPNHTALIRVYCLATVPREASGLLVPWKFQDAMAVFVVNVPDTGD